MYAEMVQVVHATLAPSSRLNVGRAVATIVPSMEVSKRALEVTPKSSQRERPGVCRSDT
jgi:hypothetical protein